MKVNQTLAIHFCIGILFFIATAPSYAASGSASDASKLPLTAYTTDPSLNLPGGPLERLMQLAREAGRIRVSVGLRFQMRPPHTLSHQASASQANSLRNIQNEVTRRVFGTQTNPETYHLHIIPVSSMLVDDVQLRTLLSAPYVESVTLDAPLYPLLNKSSAIINADQVWKAGVRGQGKTIAIIDTGVQKGHPMVLGKIVSEACYSAKTSGLESSCPGGVSESVEVNSGVECNRPDCNHGTHVAAIAAGSYYNKLASSGIARGSNIVSVNVLSYIVGNNNVTIQWIDLAKALERVYDIRNTYDIAAVNMSIGDRKKHVVPCDDYKPNPDVDLVKIIDMLRDVGIISVIATGNQGDDGGIDYPACVSPAIRVGSSNGLAISNGMTDDVVSYFSDHSKEVDLLAPGLDILSASTTPDKDRLRIDSGTSMAAPHVAGAIALLGSARLSVTSEEAVHALKCTGKPVTKRLKGGQFIAQGFETPRIDVLAAYLFLVGKTKHSTYLSFGEDYDLQNLSFFRGVWTRGGGVLRSTISSSVGNYHDQQAAIFTPCTPRDATISVRFREKSSFESTFLYSDVIIKYRALTNLTGGPDWLYHEIDGNSLYYREGDLLGDGRNIGIVVADGVGCSLDFETLKFQFHTFRIDVRGNRHNIYFDEELLCSFIDDRYAHGSIVIGTAAGYQYLSPFSVEFDFDYFNVVDVSGSPSGSPAIGNSQRPGLARKAWVINRAQEHRSTYVARRSADTRVRGGGSSFARGGGIPCNILRRDWGGCRMRWP